MPFFWTLTLRLARWLRRTFGRRRARREVTSSSTRSFQRRSRIWRRFCLGTRRSRRLRRIRNPPSSEEHDPMQPLMIVENLSIRRAEFENDMKKIVRPTGNNSSEYAASHKSEKELELRRVNMDTGKNSERKLSSEIIKLQATSKKESTGSFSKIDEQDQKFRKEMDEQNQLFEETIKCMRKEREFIEEITGIGKQQNEINFLPKRSQESLQPNDIDDSNPSTSATCIRASAEDEVDEMLKVFEQSLTIPQEDAERREILLKNARKLESERSHQSNAHGFLLSLASGSNLKNSQFFVQNDPVETNFQAEIIENDENDENFDKQLLEQSERHEKEFEELRKKRQSRNK